jgi:hypothetical protein
MPGGLKPFVAAMFLPWLKGRSASAPLLKGPFRNSGPPGPNNRDQAATCSRLFGSLTLLTVVHPPRTVLTIIAIAQKTNERLGAV